MTKNTYGLQGSGAAGRSSVQDLHAEGSVLDIGPCRFQEDLLGLSVSQRRGTKDEAAYREVDLVRDPTQETAHCDAVIRHRSRCGGEIVKCLDAEGLDPLDANGRD